MLNIQLCVFISQDILIQILNHELASQPFTHRSDVDMKLSLDGRNSSILYSLLHLFPTGYT